MMSYITIITIFILVIIGVLHFYWAFGGEFGLDKALPTDINGKHLLNPSKLLTFLVGLIMLGFSVIVYLLHYSSTSHQKYITYAGWVLSIIFLLRVIGDFNMVGIFKKIKETEFTKYDTTYIVPLCLFLASVFAILSYTREVL